MYLKRLEIFGFKTFAQRTIFEFPPGVTAIVGPNGSGKSNVADAVRWVLGEQSFANLRAKRTEELIYSGGRGRPPTGFAEVSLTIDNTDRLLSIPYDEVTIGRRAYRSGENEYTINRARVRLRDVLDLMAPIGSSYTLINQGLVDAALALHPEERRRLFEDAAEIGPYQAKKSEAERRLRETETNLIRLNDLVSELEPQLRSLRRQARDAEAVGAVEAELRAHLRRFYRRQWADLTARLTAAEADEHAVAERLRAARAARDAALQALESGREQLRTQRATVDEQRRAFGDLERRRDTVARELAVTIERAAGLAGRCEELDRRRAQLEGERESAQRQIAELEARLTTMDAELAAARERLTAAESALARELEQRRAAEAALQSERESLLRAAARLDAERARQDEIARRRAALAQEHAELEAAIGRAQAALDRRGAALAEAQAAVGEAERAVGAAAESLEERRAALERWRDERNALDERIVAARKTHGELQARFDALNRLARSFDGAFAGVKAALQWAAREGRAGFQLVSSLLRVPPELETAIEVALGARLQQIVVEQWADAEAAIAQLKRSGAGRATFLPLDTLRPGRRLTAPSLPGIRGVASELIEVDERYATVAAYLLGRTLIADDLPAARAALPRLEGGWTIVTLGGEQIATGGAVTGGAATRESGTLRRERELRELPAQVASARAAVEELQAARDRLTREIEATQDGIRAAEAALREARVARDNAQRTADSRRREAHRAEDDLAGLVRRREALARETATLAERSAQAAAAIAAAEATHAAATEATTAAEAVLQAQLAAVGSDESALREQRADVLRRETDLRGLRNERAALESALGRVTSALAEIEEHQANLERERNTLASRIETWQREQLYLDQQIDALREQLHAGESALREAERSVESLEGRERELTADTLALESAHAEAAIEAERRRSERDLLWERAAEDNLDVERLMAEPEDDSHDEGLPLDQLPGRIEQLRSRLRRMGPVNALAPEEYRAAQERYEFLTAQLDDVRAAAASLREAIGQLDHVMQEHFATTFEAVAQEFSRTFTDLFGGGSARLVLLDGDESGARGVDIIAQPPGKRQLNLQLLSGGERALTAAALLFAILTVNPSPFCILDEVDAALDEANVVRFREALLRLAEGTQFILVTHNRGTVEAANTLYGITMADDGSSRVVSLRLEEVDDGTVALA